MARHTLGRELPQALARRLRRDAARRAKLGRLHQCLRLLGDGVGRDAAVDIHDLVQRHAGAQRSVEDALLAVDQGKIRVRAEAEDRRGIVFQIVGDIRHARLLIGAQQGPDGIAQGDLFSLQIFKRIEAQDAGALVVQDAAAQKPAVLFPHHEGIAGPAVGHRHHVQMGDGGQVLLPLTQGGVADPSLAVHSPEAQLPGDLQPQLQGIPRSGAEGGIFRCLSLHAVDGHKAGDVPLDRLGVLLHKPVNVPAQNFFHDVLLLFVSNDTMQLLYHPPPQFSRSLPCSEKLHKMKAVFLSFLTKLRHPCLRELKKSPLSYKIVYQSEISISDWI